MKKIKGMLYETKTSIQRRKNGKKEIHQNKEDWQMCGIKKNFERQVTHFTGEVFYQITKGSRKTRSRSTCSSKKDHGKQAGKYCGKRSISTATSIVGIWEWFDEWQKQQDCAANICYLCNRHFTGGE